MAVRPNYNLIRFIRRCIRMLKKGILIKAHGSGDVAANTVPVFIGYSDQVTVADGFSLAPGESITIPIKGDGVYAITTVNTQNVSWATV